MCNKWVANSKYASDELSTRQGRLIWTLCIIQLSLWWLIFSLVESRVWQEKSMHEFLFDNEPENHGNYFWPEYCHGKIIYWTTAAVVVACLTNNRLEELIHCCSTKQPEETSTQHASWW